MEEVQELKLNIPEKKTLMEEIYEEAFEIIKKEHIGLVATKTLMLDLLIKKLKQTQDASDLRTDLVSVNYELTTNTINWKFRLK